MDTDWASSGGSKAGGSCGDGKGEVCVSSGAGVWLSKADRETWPFPLAVAGDSRGLNLQEVQTQLCVLKAASLLLCDESHAQCAHVAPTVPKVLHRAMLAHRQRAQNGLNDSEWP